MTVIRCRFFTEYFLGWLFIISVCEIPGRRVAHVIVWRSVARVSSPRSALKFGYLWCAQEEQVSWL